MYIALNNKIIVSKRENTTTLNNGITVQETRGKKDILQGEVYLSSREDLMSGDIVYFPEYASLPIIIEGNEYAVIDYQDIILIYR